MKKISLMVLVFMMSQQALAGRGGFFNPSSSTTNLQERVFVVDGNCRASTSVQGMLICSGHFVQEIDKAILTVDPQTQQIGTDEQQNIERLDLLVSPRDLYEEGGKLKAKVVTRTDSI